VNDPEDFNAIFDRAVEDQVLAKAADRENPRAGHCWRTTLNEPAQAGLGSNQLVSPVSGLQKPGSHGQTGMESDVFGLLQNVVTGQRADDGARLHWRFRFLSCR
jgi:hypothetical protein